MPIRSEFRRLSIVFVTLVLSVFLMRVALGNPSATEEEHILWQLWQRHQTNLTAHTQIVAICNQIESRHPRLRFLPVVQGLAAWHLLRDGQFRDAERVLLQMNRAPATPLGRNAQRMARTWLTRLDREQVRQALKVIYTKNVQFPESLDPLQALAPADRPPLTDRWGDPWIYEWTTFRFLQVGPGQRYRLESRNIRPPSDIKAALNLPYGQGIEIRPVRLIDGGGNRETIEFERTIDPPERILLAAGASYRGQTLAYLGQRILILTDGDHWAIYPKPGP